MAHAAPVLYQETRLNLDPASPSSVIDVQIPANSAFSSRLSPKRRRIDHVPLQYDEDVFSKNHIASESAIHFRPNTKNDKHHPSPRAILWRVLDERKLLELQAVDLYHDKKDKDNELGLTLRLTFPSPIRPACVVFAEREIENTSNALEAFILTKAGDLYTIILRKEHFVKQDMPLDSCISSFKIPSMSYRTPFKLFAHSNQRIWISCSDGQLVKLDRKDATWRETNYSEGGWKGSVRGIVGWKAAKTVRYDDTELHSQTAVSISTSPDGNHIWTVSLDHIIRAWSVDRGHVVARFDLGGDMDRDLQKAPDILLQPHHAQRIQVVPWKHENEYLIMTFSPRAAKFKIWLVRDIENAQHGWEDARPEVELPLPAETMVDGAIWNLESFRFEKPRPRSHEWRLWCLVRVGPQSFTCTTSFNLDSHANTLEREWQNNWARVGSGFSTAKALSENTSNPANVEQGSIPDGPESSAERWLHFLFLPGRFTPATLETALFIYRRSLGPTKKANDTRLLPSKGHPLKVRVAEAVGSSVYLGPMDEDGINFERLERATAAQWQIFFGIVKDLQTQREEILAMSVDPDEHLPWLVYADMVSPVRACSEVEALWHNREVEVSDIKADSVLVQALTGAENLQLSQFFLALEMLRECLTASFFRSFQKDLDREMLSDEEADGQTRLDNVFYRTGYAGLLSEDDYDRITDALGPVGGFVGLTDQIFQGALEFITELDRTKRHKEHEQVLGPYGRKMLMGGSSETLELSSTILLDLLLLVVFVGGELEEGDLSLELNAGEMFNVLLDQLKHVRIIQWLASAVPSVGKSQKPSGTRASRDIGRNNANSAVAYEAPNQTLQELLFLSEWSTLKFPAQSQQQLITWYIRAWTFGLPLSNKYEDTVIRVLGELIRNGETGLANAFLPFVPETSWALYLTGRLHLLLGKLDEAALCFTSAAEDLANGKSVSPDDLPAIDMLDFEEQADCLNSGLARHYLHISSLFERVKAYSYAAQFARDGLAHVGRGDDKLRTTLSSRAFSNALKSSQYSSAFTALAGIPDPTIRDSSLRTWIRSLVSHNEVDLLISTSYHDYGLVQLADSILADLATRSTTTKSGASSSPFDSSHTDQQPSTSYHKILYAFRLQQSDMRGAACSLWDRLQFLRYSQDAGLRGEDIDEEVAECYLALINCLSLVKQEQAWILYRPLQSSDSKDGEKPKRRIVTLEDVRRAWQEELDRVADVAAGRFAIGLEWEHRNGVNGAGHDMPGSFGRETESMEIDVAS